MSITELIGYSDESELSEEQLLVKLTKLANQYSQSTDVSSRDKIYISLLHEQRRALTIQALKERMRLHKEEKPSKLKVRLLVGEPSEKLDSFSRNGIQIRFSDPTDHLKMHVIGSLLDELSRTAKVNDSEIFFRDFIGIADEVVIESPRARFYRTYNELVSLMLVHRYALENSDQELIPLLELQQQKVFVNRFLPAWLVQPRKAEIRFINMVMQITPTGVAPLFLPFFRYSPETQQQIRETLREGRRRI